MISFQIAIATGFIYSTSLAFDISLLIPKIHIMVPHHFEWHMFYKAISSCIQSSSLLVLLSTGIGDRHDFFDLTVFRSLPSLFPVETMIPNGRNRKLWPKKMEDLKVSMR